MNILVTKLVTFQFMKVRSEAGVTIFYDSPDLEELFHLSLKKFRPVVICLQETDHRSFFETEGRNSMILTLLGPDDKRVRVVVCSHEFYSTVLESIRKIFIKDSGSVVYGIDQLFEEYEFTGSDKKITRRRYFLPYDNNKYLEHEDPKRISD